MSDDDYSEDAYDEIVQVIEGMDTAYALTALIRALADIVAMGEPDADEMGRRMAIMIESLCIAVTLKTGVNITASSEIRKVH